MSDKEHERSSTGAGKERQWSGIRVAPSKGRQGRDTKTAQQCGRSAKGEILGITAVSQERQRSDRDGTRESKEHRKELTLLLTE